MSNTLLIFLIIFNIIAIFVGIMICLDITIKDAEKGVIEHDKKT
jgi:hypothetical protein